MSKIMGNLFSQAAHEKSSIFDGIILPTCSFFYLWPCIACLFGAAGHRVPAFHDVNYVHKFGAIYMNIDIRGHGPKRREERGRSTAVGSRPVPVGKYADRCVARLLSPSRYIFFR